MEGTCACQTYDKALVIGRKRVRAVISLGFNTLCFVKITVSVKLLCFGLKSFRCVCGIFYGVISHDVGSNLIRTKSAAVGEINGFGCRHRSARNVERIIGNFDLRPYKILASECCRSRIRTCRKVIALRNRKRNRKYTQRNYGGQSAHNQNVFQFSDFHQKPPLSDNYLYIEKIFIN